MLPLGNVFASGWYVPLREVTTLAQELCYLTWLCVVLAVVLLPLPLVFSYMSILAQAHDKLQQPCWHSERARHVPGVENAKNIILEVKKFL